MREKFEIAKPYHSAFSQLRHAEQLHEGERESVHLSLVGARFILVMIFDKRSSSGLVRLRARRAQEQLEEIFERARRRSTEGPSASFSELSDDDIDNLFRDS